MIETMNKIGPKRNLTTFLNDKPHRPTREITPPIDENNQGYKLIFIYKHAIIVLHNKKIH
jgi:hypothetical protein